MSIQFVDEHGAVDKEKLRVFGLEALRHYKEILDVLTSPDLAHFWEDLHNTIGMVEEQERKADLRNVEAQLTGLRDFVESYIKNALDSAERFELFIQTKAADLDGSDSVHDYYWALQIRLDQVVSLVEELGEILTQLQDWTHLPPKEVIADKTFMELSKNTIEDRIYFTAQNNYSKRTRSSGR